MGKNGKQVQQPKNQLPANASDDVDESDEEESAKIAISMENQPAKPTLKPVATVK